MRDNRWRVQHQEHKTLKSRETILREMMQQLMLCNAMTVNQRHFIRMPNNISLSLSLSSSFQISFLCLKEVMQKERLKNEDGEENGGIERQWKMPASVIYISSQVVLSFYSIFLLICLLCLHDDDENVWRTFPRRRVHSRMPLPRQRVLLLRKPEDLPNWSIGLLRPNLSKYQTSLLLSQWCTQSVWTRLILPCLLLKESLRCLDLHGKRVLFMTARLRKIEGKNRWLERENANHDEIGENFTGESRKHERTTSSSSQCEGRH